jgi:hypothetical protein
MKNLWKKVVANILYYAGMLLVCICMMYENSFLKYFWLRLLVGIIILILFSIPKLLVDTKDKN